MAVVTSYTAQRILDFLEPVDTVEAKQAELDALITQLRLIVEGNDASQAELENVILPQLQDQLSANNLTVADLRDNVVSNLESTVTQHSSELDDLRTVTVPSLVDGMAAEIQNSIDRPKVYVQPEAPENPDDDDRDLVYGDSWFDSDDNNRQRIWNGAEWTTFAIDIPDLSLTVQKFKTGTHMIY